MMYSELKLELIVQTLATLRNRIQERFPGSGLGRVAEELLRNAETTGPLLEQLRRPNWLLRVGVGLAVLVMVAPAALLYFYLARASRETGALASLGFEAGGLGALLQTLESAVQNVIFLSLAIYFLISLEGRQRRKLSLTALHRLRSIVHIVDMHQLTKDPEHVLTPGMSTASSPVRRLSRFELARYFDYCSELLSLSSKLAALHVQYNNDPIVLDAVNDVEVLASNLSNKLWQKIVILDTAGLTAAQPFAQERVTPSGEAEA
jgi:hypothetical protein